MKDLNVVLYADSHFGSGGREGLAAAMTSLTKKDPTVIDPEEHGLTANDVNSADLIVIYHTQAKLGAETKEVLVDWVAEGNALSIVHAGLGAWPEWDAHQKWCGLIWEWGVSTHPHSQVVIKTNEASQVPFTYTEGWLPKDEVFIKLKEMASLSIDATVETTEGEVYPAAWHNEALPNIGCWMPGHMRSSWSVPTMVQGLEAVVLLTLGK